MTTDEIEAKLTKLENDTKVKLREKDVEIAALKEKLAAKAEPADYTKRINAIETTLNEL